MKNTCVLTELEEENIVAPTSGNSTVLEMTDDEVVEVAQQANLEDENNVASTSGKSTVLKMTDVEVVEVPQLANLTPHRRRRKPRCPIDVKLLRRSLRLNPDRAGFRTQEAADAAAMFRSAVISEGAARDGPAPFLLLQIVQGIDESFLQMNPEDLSEEALVASPVISDDEEAA